MALIEVVLVPFWRGAPPAEFREWFAAHSGRIRAVMVPLGAGAGAAPLPRRWHTSRRENKAAPASVAAAGATAGVVGITAAVNERANRRFEAGALTDSETAELLGRWARWHHGRVVLGLAATLAAVLTVAQRDA